MAKAPDVLTHQIPGDTMQQRLATYVVGLYTDLLSKKSIKKAIGRGEFSLYDPEGNPTTWVIPGGSIKRTTAPLAPPEPYDLEMKVVYEDDSLAVIIKPAGIEVSGNKRRTVVAALSGNLTPSAAPDAMAWAKPVHRLDYSTSGLLLIAKTQSAMIALHGAFANRLIEKEYRAVVMGAISGSQEFRSMIDGKYSHSKAALLERIPSLKNGELCRMALVPMTGRKHQLRLHLAEAGFPILGDPLYSPEEQTLKGKGMFLCSVKLGFTHPLSGEQQRVEIPEPAKWQTFLDRERKLWEDHHKR